MTSSTSGLGARDSGDGRGRCPPGHAPSAQWTVTKCDIMSLRYWSTPAAAPGPHRLCLCSSSNALGFSHRVSSSFQCLRETLPSQHLAPLRRLPMRIPGLLGPCVPSANGMRSLSVGINASRTKLRRHTGMPGVGSISVSPNIVKACCGPCGTSLCLGRLPCPSMTSSRNRSIFPT